MSDEERDGAHSARTIAVASSGSKIAGAVKRATRPIPERPAASGNNSTSGSAREVERSLELEEVDELASFRTETDDARARDEMFEDTSQVESSNPFIPSEDEG